MLFTPFNSPVLPYSCLISFTHHSQALLWNEVYIGLNGFMLGVSFERESTEF
jgi:hypothetical protein